MKILMKILDINEDINEEVKKTKKEQEFINFIEEYGSIKNDHVNIYKLNVNVLKNVEEHYMNNKSGGNFNFEIFDSVSVYKHNDYIDVDNIK